MIFTVSRFAQALRAKDVSSSGSNNNDKFGRTNNNDAVARILATSASGSPSHILFPRDGNDLCQHRKGFVEHLYPRPLATSTMRVVVQQGTTVLGTFFTDQIKVETERSEKVDQGLISQDQADKEAEEWEKEEWDRRIQTVPHRIVVGLMKYHATTLLMRTYEYFASQRFDKFTLDKLTKDPFRASKSVAEREVDKYEIAREMFSTSLWANLIAFLADYTVHQVILCYGYYVYMRHRQRRDTGRNTKEGLKGAAAISLFSNSMQLVFVRLFGLALSSVGSAVGSVVLPGWGTLIMSNMGDSAVSMILDDGQAPSVPPADQTKDE